MLVGEEGDVVPGGDVVVPGGGVVVAPVGPPDPVFVVSVTLVTVAVMPVDLVGVAVVGPDDVEEEPDPEGPEDPADEVLVFTGSTAALAITAPSCSFRPDVADFDRYAQDRALPVVVNGEAESTKDACQAGTGCPGTHERTRTVVAEVPAIAPWIRTDEEPAGTAPPIRLLVSRVSVPLRTLLRSTVIEPSGNTLSLVRYSEAPLWRSSTPR